MHRFILLVLACLIFLELPAFSDEGTWEDAVSALKSNEFDKASEKLSSWIKQKAVENIYSPEAHYNLFLAQIGLESSGPAVAHLLRSIQIEKNPFKNLEALNTLCDLQSRYGIKDGPCQTKYFTFSMLLGKNFLTITTCLFLWGLVFSCLFYFKKKNFLFKSVLLATILVGGGNLLTYLVTKSDYPILVLSGTEKNISIYKSEAGREEEKLVELSQGTLVEGSSEIKNGKRKITQPIVGWVSEEQMIKVNESLSQNPTFSIQSPKHDSF